MAIWSHRTWRWARRAVVGLLIGFAALLVGCPPQSDTRVSIDVGQPTVPPISAGSTASGNTSLKTFDWLHSADSARPPAIAPIGRATPMSGAWDAGKGQLSLAGFGRETLGFRFRIAAPPGGLSNVRVLLTDLERVAKGGASRIARDKIEIFRILPTRVVNLPGWHQLYETPAVNRSAGDFPDALIDIAHPRLGAPWRLAAGETLDLWVDVPIPADTTPGTYEGQLTIASENLPAGRLAIHLDVLPLNLPAEPVLRLYCPVDIRQMLASELGRAELSDSLVLSAHRDLAARRLAQWVELGRSHGVEFLAADLAPVYTRDLKGQLEIDWAGYDAVVGPHLAGPTTAPACLAPFRLDYPDPAKYGGIKAAPYRELVGQYLKAVGKHWSANKWPKPLVWIHRDEPARATLPYGCLHWRDCLSDARRAESLAIGDMVWKAEVDLGWLDVLPWAMRKSKAQAAPANVAHVAPPAGEDDPLAVANRLVPPHVMNYCPPAEFLDPATLPALRDEGLTVWLGEGNAPWRPSLAVFAHPEQLESLAYIAYRTAVTNVWLGPAQRWPMMSPQQVPLTPSNANFLFYSGRWFDTDRPVASLRLKFLREAVQTAAKLQLLNDLRRPGAANAVAAAMVKYAAGDAATAAPGLGRPIGWQQEPVFYEDARLMLREELLRATGRSGKDSAVDRLKFLWLQFHERTAWMRLEPLPGQLVDRVDAAGLPDGSLRSVLRMMPYCDAAVCRPGAAGSEGLRWPLLNFGSLPASWKPSRYNVPVDGSSPLPPIVLSLAADGIDLSIDKTGRIAMPLTVKTDTGQELSPPACSTPILPAHRFRRAPTIDGKLDDWPIESWYRGAGFVRLAMADPASVFTQPVPPAMESWCMAGYDDDNLYLAVACLGQKPTEVTTRYANAIEMDRGLIVGEDAVEIVLDPTGGRLDRQGLLHLAVKPTGTVIGWRGMTGPNGAGPAELWGRTVRAAVGFQPTYWLMELAIPRKELGEVNERGLWRINVIRHVAARGEHSGWASSSPMIGEPDSLGTLLLRNLPLPKREVQLIPPSPLGD